MNLSKKGFDLINHFETGGKPSRYLNAYWDATGKVWTIGIGSTRYADGSPVRPGDRLTEQEAYALFRATIGKYEDGVRSRLRVEVSQRQFDALVSLAYNVGVGGFGTLLGMVNDQKPLVDLPAQWYKYVRSGGKVLDGLKWRRAAEFHYYCTGRLVTDRAVLRSLYESRRVPGGGPGPGNLLFGVLLAVAALWLLFSGG